MASPELPLLDWPKESPVILAGDSQLLSHCIERTQAGQGFVEPIHQRKTRGGCGSSKESSSLTLNGGVLPAASPRLLWSRGMHS